MLVKVKREHFEQGRAKSSWECPITLAVKEKLSKKNVSVHTYSDASVNIYDIDKKVGKIYRPSVPQRAFTEEWIRKFDKGEVKNFTPFSIRIRKNDEYHH